jgi:nucleoside-diphosphate-sugar epimerase
MNRILFTGEEGNLAQGLIRELEHIPEFEICESHPRLKKIHTKYHPWPELDLASGTMIDAIRETSAEIIVHIAAIVNTDKCDNDPKMAIDANLLGTQQVLQACQETGVKLIYYSTTATYDPAAPRPFTEISNQRPPTLYGITKLAGEHLVCGQSKVPWIVIRPCFVFGHPPRDHSSQICKIAVHQSLLKHWPEKAGPIPHVTLDPENLKDYMTTKDFCRGVASVMQGDHWGQIFNISNGEPIKMGQFFEVLREALGTDKLDMVWEPEADYMGHHIVSNSKITALTDWKPSDDPLDGVRKLAGDTEEYVKRCKEGKAELLYR